MKKLNPVPTPSIPPSYSTWISRLADHVGETTLDLSNQHLPRVPLPRSTRLGQNTLLVLRETFVGPQPKPFTAPEVRFARETRVFEFLTNAPAPGVFLIHEIKVANIMINHTGDPDYEYSTFDAWESSVLNPKGRSWAFDSPFDGLGLDIRAGVTLSPLNLVIVKGECTGKHLDSPYELIITMGGPGKYTCGETVTIDGSIAPT